MFRVDMLRHITDLEVTIRKEIFNLGYEWTLPSMVLGTSVSTKRVPFRVGNVRFTRLVTLKEFTSFELTYYTPSPSDASTKGNKFFFFFSTSH